MLTILRNEGVEFAGIFIDESFEQDNSPNRKPRTGLLIPYLQQNQIDLNQSYVIGDRYTDVELARNLGCKSIRFGEENDPEADTTLASWPEIVDYLCSTGSSRAKLERNTKEDRKSVVYGTRGTVRVDPGGSRNIKK